MTYVFRDTPGALLERLVVEVSLGDLVGRIEASAFILSDPSCIVLELARIVLSDEGALRIYFLTG